MYYSTRKIFPYDLGNLKFRLYPSTIQLIPDVVERILREILFLVFFLGISNTSDNNWKTSMYVIAFVSVIPFTLRRREYRLSQFFHLYWQITCTDFIRICWVASVAGSESINLESRSATVQPVVFHDSFIQSLYVSISVFKKISVLIL